MELYCKGQKDVNKTYLFSYNGYSKGAKALATALRIRRIRHYGSRFKNNEKKVVINWGSTALPFTAVGNQVILNCSDVVEHSRDKLRFFQKVSGSCRCVPWTTDIQQAEVWNEKSTVICRMSLTGQSGSGIIIVPPQGQVSEAPLYTKYIPKDMEFRVHIIDGEIIDVQRKIRDPSREPSDWKIRSHNNGFTFIRSGFRTPGDVLEQTRLAFNGSQLDFAAFDVLWREKKQEAYILEANSAPGLQGQTIGKYAIGLYKLIQKRRKEMNG